MAYSSSSSPEISVAPTVSTQEYFSYKHASHEEVLEDLSSRFILNLPDEELASLERICFQVEQAHWFYEDFIREENPKFPSLPLKKFSAMLFHACPLLHQWSHDHEQAFNTFMQYKTRVPVCGAIMLNDTWEKCILVKGWKSSSGWGFPKGKINEHEAPHDCAIREVLEETGYNLAGDVDPQDVIEMSIKEQKISLYIVAGVPEDFHFQTRTRKEISRIEWFKLTDLPTWKRNKAAPGKFYLISPFIGALKAFINERKPRSLQPKLAKKGRTASIPQAVQARPKQTTNSFSVQSLAACHEPTMQESSSQSSSADNCGPHTPSPQYNESIVNHPANGHVTTQAEEDISKTLTTAMDPDLARLLNSLSMSAAVPVDDKDDAKPNLTPLPIRHTPGSTTPVPITASSTSPPLLPQRPEQIDWSSHVPMPLSERPVDLNQAPVSSSHGSASMDTRPLPDSTQISSRHHLPPPTLSLSTRSNGSNAAPQDPPTPLSAALSVSSVTSSMASSARKSSSRRSSSTADISPYLSRSSEIPTSGKRLKQLALLETVVDESTRMIPLLENRDKVLQPGGPIIGAPGYRPAPSGRHSYASGSPISVVPSPMNSDMNDLRVVYSSEHGPAPMQSGLLHHPHPQATPLPNYDDPFQVRPRTSQAMHTSSTYTGHPFGGRPASMHQSQLLSLLTGPSSERPNPHTPPPAPPASHLIGPYPHPIFDSSHSFQHSIPNHSPLPPLQVISRNPYPPQGQPMPVSAPALSPTFNLPPNNLNLLSILNGTKSMATRGASGSNIMAPPGALSEVMHR